MKIHPTAIVSKKAELADDIIVGPYAIIEDNVKIDSGTEIRNGAIIANGATIGKNNRIHSYAAIATEPQDLKYANEPTEVIIGDDNVIREYVTINRATVETGKTILGNNSLIMTYSHIAHDCVVGNNVILANSCQLAGHVHIEDWVILGGVAKVHQFCSVGQHAMVAADAMITKDVIPYAMVGRVPPKVEGLNKIGLRRRGFSKEVISALEECIDTILHSGMNITKGIEAYEAKYPVIQAEVQVIIDFIRSSRRGIYN